MKYSKIFVLLLLTLAAYFLSLSCGIGPGSLSCIQNADCASDEVCLDSGACRQPCDDDAECGVGFACLPRLLAEGVIGDACSIDETVDEPCSKDSDCNQTQGASDARCSIDNVCFIPQTLYSILIRDTSPDGSLGSDGLDGSDIAAVYLTIDDKIVAQGSTLVAKNESGDALTSPIKGGPPKLNAAMTCVDGDFSDRTVHLGRKGFLLVRFLDTNFSDYLEGPSTWNINVIEWGKNCDIADDGDTYEVSLCTSSSYENIDFERECVQIGTGDGFSEFTTE